MSEDLCKVSALLVHTEDQEELRSMARSVVAAEAPIARFRAMRDAGEASDPALWGRLVALGWPGITFAEGDGGLGLGLVEAAIVMEELGRTLAVTPMLSVVMVGAVDVSAGVQAGTVVALAWQEAGRRPDAAQVRARCEAGRLTGEKVAVLDARSADAFVVSALDGERLGLFRVAASDAVVTPLVRLDHRDAGHVRFVDAPATPLPGGLAELQAALDAGTIVLAAEMLGGAAAALERTLAWLREREQFDVPIGSFQALQHRAVDLFIAVELARSAVMAAAVAHAEGAPVSALASLCKARVNQTFLLVAREAVQMHGGIGMTDECDIGLYLKRAAVAAETLGNTTWHRDRWARLHGY